MDTKKVLLIIIAFICILGCYNYIIMENTYKTITINEVMTTVPISNVSVENSTDHFSTYEDLKNGIKIYVFDDDNASLLDVKEMFNFITIRDENQLEVIVEEDNDYSFNYSSSLNEYTYLNNKNNKNIFVITKDKDDMLKIIKTIKYNITNNDSNNDYQEKIIEDTVKYHPQFN